MHLLIIAVMIQKVKRKEPKSPNVQSNFAKSFLSQLRCQIPNKGVLKWRTIVEIHRNENFQKLIILIYTTKVKCSYSAPKFRFEFGYGLFALYFTALTVMFVINLADSTLWYHTIPNLIQT